MKVLIPSQLRDYTGGRAHVEAHGATLAGLLADLERSYPGIRFRMIDEQDAIRRHIKIFVNQQLTRDLGAALAANDEVVIVGALSGGQKRIFPSFSRGGGGGAGGGGRPRGSWNGRGRERGGVGKRGEFCGCRII